MLGGGRIQGSGLKVRQPGDCPQGSGVFKVSSSFSQLESFRVLRVP